jgi:hypothetical protein
MVEQLENLILQRRMSELTVTKQSFSSSLELCQIMLILVSFQHLKLQTSHGSEDFDPQEGKLLAIFFSGVVGCRGGAVRKY